MEKKMDILAAISDDGLVKRLKNVFDGNLKIVGQGGQAVNDVYHGSHSVVVLDYAVAGNAVQAAIKIRAFSDNVEIVGYRWDTTFAGMTNYNAASERQLAYRICQYIGMDKVNAQDIAGRFDNSDQTPKPERR